MIRCLKAKQLNYAILFNALPKDYGPLYNEFINLVTNEFGNISSWPSHDLFLQGTGIEETITADNLLLSPNPASYQINIGDAQLKPQSIVSIINLEGREVLRYTIASALSDFDISKLETGIYFFRILDEQGNIKIKKFAKR